MEPEQTCAAAVLAILDALERAGVPASIGGGWGIDALLGRQTRAHGDLDLCFDAKLSNAAQAGLQELGYKLTLDERPTRFVMAKPGGGEIDLHPLQFLPDGTARLPSPDGTEFVFPAGCLDGSGTIGGRTVRCFTRDRQIAIHTGYRPREIDLLDMAHLRELDPVSTDSPA